MIGDYHRIKIDSLAYGGAGVGRLDGKVCFIPFTAPGDLVRVKITGKKKRYLSGEIAQIIDPSPFRVEPRCPLFGVCGGCRWQHIAYGEQLRAKEKILADTISRIGGITPSAGPIVPSPKQYSYRNSARFAVTLDGFPAFRGGGSNMLVRIEKCPVLEDELNGYLPELASSLKALSYPPEEAEIYLDQNGNITWHPVYEGSRRYEGGRKGSVFHQANHGINEHLKKIIASNVTELASLWESVHITDIFCGDGNLSLPLAGNARGIVGADSSKISIEYAVKKAGLLPEHIRNRIKYSHARFPDLLRERTYQSPEDGCLIIDPPRDGLSGYAGETAALGFKTVLYVTCSPPTFARDAGKFGEAGYELEKIIPLDMFPQTDHMEAVGIFRKSSQWSRSPNTLV